MMTSVERLKKAKIQLMMRNPFFSFLSVHLKVQEDTEGIIPENMGIAIDSRGIMYYKDAYIKTLTNEQIIGVLCHEILHLSLLHLLRRGERQPQRWDMATDLSVNSILLQNKIQLPYDAVVPDNKDIFMTEDGTTIEECSKKTAEELYSIIPEQPQEDQNQNSGGGQGQGNGNGQGQGNGNGDNQDQNNQDNNQNQNDNKDNQNNGQNQNQQNKNQPQNKQKGFDSHLPSNDMSNKEKKDTEDDWKDKTMQAAAYAKSKGNLPLGLERLISELHKEKVKWRSLLHRYLQQLLPVDYCWSRPSKKSLAAGTYLPSVTKEKISVCVGIDASGSISDEELVDFLSEMVGVARTYQGSIDMRILTHDVDVHTDILISNANKELIKKIKIKGGGGTSHQPIMNYINEKVRNCKISIFFTDGYSDLENIDFHKNSFQSIFVISANGNSNSLEEKKVKIIKLEKKEK